jgi:dTDP-4-dehydrorhamnose 3,5-epimerase
VRFVPLELEGAFRVDAEPMEDERGFFARTFCADTFAARGLQHRFTQTSVSFNRHVGTLRGMHYADPPEVKLVRPIRGAIFDVLVDLRAGSPTFRRWVGLELRGPQAVYVPAGLAHGFLTLEPDTEVEYAIDLPYDAASGRGFRWDDPAVGVRWPSAPAVMSERDRAWAGLA